MLNDKAVAGLLGLGASGVREAKARGFGGLVEKGLGVLNERPQLRDALETALVGVVGATGVPRPVIQAVLNVALPVLVEQLGTVAADFELQKRDADTTGLGLGNRDLT